MPPVEYLDLVAGFVGSNIVEYRRLVRYIEKTLRLSEVSSRDIVDGLIDDEIIDIQHWDSTNLDYVNMRK